MWAVREEVRVESRVVVVPTAPSMHALGRRLAALLQPGDLVLACGALGAGKTALTQGIGAGLDVEGAVISPTFVLSRVHRSRRGGPTLVHVDAYRLADLAEVEDLDLEASLADSVTVVEWGEGKAEQLADDRLDVVIVRSSDPEDETRTVTFTGTGLRWEGVDLTLDATPEEIDE
jgi:tRNA threonylcarbamoyladenosine biosynthesis protein TsaE